MRKDKVQKEESKLNGCNEKGHKCQMEETQYKEKERIFSELWMLDCPLL